MDAIVDLKEIDAENLLALNNENARETSYLDAAALRSLLDMAFYARGMASGMGGCAAALLIAFDHDAAYANPNFAWFLARRVRFVYIDRVVVARSFRGQGMARRIYADLMAAARAAGHDRLVCEINREPPNPASEAFHLAMGFVAVGEAAIRDGTKVVRYFEKALH